MSASSDALKGAAVDDFFSRRFKDRAYFHVEMINHRGSLVAIAMDEDRKLVYSVLESSAMAEGAGIDSQAWSPSPRELPFPTEIYEAGFGDLTRHQMPAPRFVDPNPEAAAPWHQSTGRLTAKAPFQALSDNDQIYIFRQSLGGDDRDVPTVSGGPFAGTKHDIPGDDASKNRLDAGELPKAMADMIGVDANRSNVVAPKVEMIEAKKRWLVAYDGRRYQVSVADQKIKICAARPIMSQALLVDRYVLVGSQLKIKSDVRFRRSRRPDHPENETDTLGVRDMEGRPFLVPTVEAKFVGEVSKGQFRILLLPAAEAELHRWQIFNYNAGSKKIDCFNLDTDSEGIFNTQGRRFYTSPDAAHRSDVFESAPGTCPFTNKPLVPIKSRAGYAETCLSFDGTTRVTVPTADAAERKKDFRVQSYTVECWFKPEEQQNEYWTMIFGGMSEAGRHFNVFYGHSNDRIHASFSSGAKGKPDYNWSAHFESATNSVPRNEWVHIALTQEKLSETETVMRLFINGSETMTRSFEAPQSIAEKDAPMIHLGGYEGHYGFKGEIDEVRIWNRPRNAKDIDQLSTVRLTGDEPGLVGYWRCDEGSGTRLINSATVSTGAHEGAIEGGKWAVSEAPIGDAEGMRVSALCFEGQEIVAGPAAVLYHQQEVGGQDTTTLSDKKLRQNARVMLSVPTRSVPTNESEDPVRSLSVLDFAVSREARLSQVPDALALEEIEGTAKENELDPNEVTKRAKKEEELSKALTTLSAKRNDPFAYPNRVSSASQNYALHTVMHNIHNGAGNFYFEPVMASGDQQQKLVDGYRVFNIYAKSDYTGEPQYLTFRNHRDVEQASFEPLGQDRAKDEYCVIPVTHSSDSCMLRRLTGEPTGQWSMIVPEWSSFVASDGKTYNVMVMGLWTAGYSDISSYRTRLHWRLIREGDIDPKYQQAVDAARADLDTLTLKETPRYVMPLLAVDRHGLSTTGMRLKHIKTDARPSLLSGSDGRLGLYFRNAKEEGETWFTAASFDTSVQRRLLSLNLGQDSDLRFVARAVETKPELTVTASKKTTGYLHIKISYTAAVAGPTKSLQETFDTVPARAEAVAAIISGAAAAQHDLGALAVDYTGNAENVVLKGSLKSKLGAAQVVVAGNLRLVRKRTSAGFEAAIEDSEADTTSIPVQPVPLNASAGTRAAMIAYDYDQHDTSEPDSAAGRKEPGSRAIMVLGAATGALSVPTAEPGIKAEVSREAVSSYWSASGVGTSLRFSEHSAAQSDKPLDLEDAVTVEAWIKPTARPKLNGTNKRHARFLTHFPEAGSTAQPAFGMELDTDGTNDEKGLELGFTIDNISVLSRGSGLKTGEWSHVAATYKRSSAIAFEGGYLDCGNSSDWNLDQELTIEIIVKPKKGAKANELLQDMGLIGKGRLGAGQAGKGVPYAAWLKQDGAIVFSIDDVAADDQSVQKRHEFATDAGVIKPGEQQVISIVRRSQTDLFGGIDLDTFDPSLRDTKIKKGYGDDDKEKIDNAQRADYLASKRKQSNADNTGVAQGIGSAGWQIEIYVDGAPKFAARHPGARVPINDEVLEIGRVRYGDNRPIMRGEISDVRIWEKALSRSEVNRPLTGQDDGLRFHWTFDEFQGAASYETKSGRPARFTGALGWVRSAHRIESAITLWVNGQSVATTTVTRAAFTERPGVQVGRPEGWNDAYHSKFTGELDEVRVWRSIRHQEQLLDAMFTRIREGGAENLVAYYPCSLVEGRMVDRSGREAHLDFVPDSQKKNATPFYKAPKYAYTSAPIGDDASCVRTAFASVDTAFHRKIDSSPAVREYGDAQPGPSGSVHGVLKRAYAFIEGKALVLTTGHKIGDLVTEWVGQVQFNPQIKGFIEGPPPVPSENLTEGLANADTYGNFDNASKITYSRASKTERTVSNSKSGGYGSAFDIGINSSMKAEISTVIAPIGFGIEITPTIEFGGKFSFGMEQDTGFESSEAITGSEAVDRKLELGLVGVWEDEDHVLNPVLHRRYKPSNMGMALVESDTADVYTMRLHHNSALVGMRFIPSADIPRDVNLVPFPINPRYTKLGTLDGRVGYDAQGSPQADPDYANMQGTGEYSYYKPREAYRIKRQIAAEVERLKAEYHDHYGFKAGVAAGQAGGAAAGGVAGMFGGVVGGIKMAKAASFLPSAVTAKASSGITAGIAGGVIAGAGAATTIGTLIANAITDRSLPDKLAPRNIVNTYVWTADGGFYSESTGLTESHQSETNSSYAFKGSFKGGMFFNVSSSIGPQRALELNGAFSGNYATNAAKSETNSTSFSVEVSLGVPTDLQSFYDPADTAKVKRRFDDAGEPILQPGKVDAYRFMTFYLEPSTGNTRDFFGKVVDPQWLRENPHPNAAALRQVQASNRMPSAWRILHRVTFRSRILPANPAVSQPQSLDEAVQKAKLSSHYRLIQVLDPYVRQHASDPAALRGAIHKGISQSIPELSITEQTLVEITQLLQNYYGT